jgi:hypothetical protein
MALVPLTLGAYKAQSLIANAQRCINLFPEKNPEGAKFPFTMYPTPGLTLLATPGASGVGRGVYCDSQGNLYCVVGTNVYYVNSSWQMTLLGQVANYTTPVSFSDNGLAVVVVDGSTIGYAINISSALYNGVVTPLYAFGTIGDPNFLGATKADYVDSFLLFHQPNTGVFYCSLSNVNFSNLTTQVGGILTGTITAAGTSYTPGTYTNVSLTGGTGRLATATITVNSSGNVSGVSIAYGGKSYLVNDVLSANAGNIGGTGSGFQFTVSQVGTSGGAFNPLYYASKTGSPDPIQSIQVVHREIWLIGSKTSEVWYDSGAATFPFQIMPGAFIEHGTAAPYSIAQSDLNVFFLGKDKQGQTVVFMGEGYQAKRISTHAQEAEFATYSTISDAIGYTYQQLGHTFYVLTFPTANTTWVFDLATRQWHQRAYSDNNGLLQRHRGMSAAAAYGVNVVQDWQTGALYKFDPTSFTDNGQTMQYIRGFPTLANEGKRVKYKSFIADMEVGTDTGSVDGTSQTNPPLVSLRFSDDGGKSFNNPITQSLGALGQYQQSLKWTRLGLARNRVFEVSWSCPTKSALNGAWIEPEAANS